mgnify:CR=1 FL=1
MEKNIMCLLLFVIGCTPKTTMIENSKTCLCRKRNLKTVG